MISSVATTGAVITQRRHRQATGQTQPDTRNRQDDGESSSKETSDLEEVEEDFSQETIQRDSRAKAALEVQDSAAQPPFNDRGPPPEEPSKDITLDSKPLSQPATEPAPPVPQAPFVRSQLGISQHVNCLLQLTKDRFGAGVRVQLKLGDDFLLGVAESAEASDRSSNLNRRNKAQQSSQEALSSKDTISKGVDQPGVKEVVEGVYTYDLYEDNLEMQKFLISITAEKAKEWQKRRDKAEAESGCRKCLYSKWRQTIYMTLSYPDFEYSKLAYWIGVFIIAIILLNVITFCIESVPSYAGTTAYHRLIIVDYVCLAIFTVEYVLRLVCCPDLRRFMTSLSNTIDLVAILPFYVELAVTGSTTTAFQTRIVRLLRLLRVLRIVKSMPSLRHLNLVVDTLSNSVNVLVMLAFLLTVLLVVFGTVFYFVEPDTFDSIPEAMYYAQTTFTTTGYGDIYPVTPWGRFVAGAAMLLCMVVVSLPIAVLGGDFSDKWSHYKAFKASVDRSKQISDTAVNLREAMERYESVLDEVIGRMQEYEENRERQMASMRHTLAFARHHLFPGGSEDTPTPGGGTARRTGGAVGAKVKSILQRVGSSISGSRAGSVTTGGLQAVGSSSRAGNMTDLAAKSGADDISGSGHSPGGGGGGDDAAPPPQANGGVATGALASPRQHWRNIGRLVVRDRTRLASSSSAAARDPSLQVNDSPCVTLSLDLEAADGRAVSSEPEGGGPEGGRPRPPPVEGSTGGAAAPMPGPPAAPPPPAPPAPPPPIVPGSFNDSAFASPPAAVVSRPAGLVRAVSAAFGSAVSAILTKRHNNRDGGQSHLGLVEWGALQEARNALNVAAESCKKVRDVQVQFKVLAQLAELLRSDDLPNKLDKLEEQYRALRCWQEELAPMADHMWRVRNALDRLAWALMEGMPPPLSEDEKKERYSPATLQERVAEDRRMGAPTTIILEEEEEVARNAGAAAAAGGVAIPAAAARGSVRDGGSGSEGLTNSGGQGAGGVAAAGGVAPA